MNDNIPQTTEHYSRIRVSLTDEQGYVLDTMTLLVPTLGAPHTDDWTSTLRASNKLEDYLTRTFERIDEEE